MPLLIQQFLDDETGATAIEYGLIAALLSLAIIGGVGKAAGALTWLWNGNNSELANAFR